MIKTIFVLDKEIFDQAHVPNLRKALQTSIFYVEHSVVLTL